MPFTSLCVSTQSFSSQASGGTTSDIHTQIPSQQLHHTVGLFDQQHSVRQQLSRGLSHFEWPLKKMFVLTKVSCRRFRVVLMALFPLSAFSFQAFSSGSNLLKYQRLSPLHVTTTSPEDPQVLAAGYSQAINMNEALQEATEMALQALPKAKKNSKIDLAVVSVSSLYDGNASPSDVVPTVVEAASTYGKGIENLVGSTAGGFISSAANLDGEVLADDDEDERIARGCLPIEGEGVPGVSVTLCVLPDVTVKVSETEFEK